MKKAILICMMIILLSGCWETRTGEKIGNIVKFAKEGLFFKTYEVELMRGGFSNGSGSTGATFDVTVEDKKLIPVIEEAVNNHKSVVIKYHQELFTLPGRCESHNYFMDDIKIVS